MTDHFPKYMQALHSLFNEDFMSAYTEATPKTRKRMLPYLQACYRRWYYSTLIENIHFSPTNLVGSIGYTCGMPADIHLVAEIAQPVSRLSEIGLKVLTYTIDNHPVVEDLCKVVEFCTPHIDLCEEWCFSDSQAQKVAKKLSQQDPYYASFLLEVAYALELLERMPSLYVQRMQVAETSPEILELPNAELLQKIVNTVIQLTAIGLQNTLPVPVPLFTEDGIRRMLADPITVDEILDHAFTAIGYDLDGLLTQETLDSLSDLMEEDENTAEMINGIFILGVMLDRLFFTPFGSFLRIIRPVYSIPFNFEAEMSNHLHAFGDEEDNFAAFFAPCTSYTLTDIGLAILDVTPTENNYFNTTGIIPKDMLESMLFASPTGIRIFVQAARDAIPLSEMPDSIYTFRIYLEEAPDVWITMQISKTATLHNLCDAILDEFYVIDDGQYSFYHSETQSHFTEYISATDIERFRKVKLDKRKYSKGNKHTHIQLLSLDFEHEKHLLLVLDDPTQQNFKMEWLSETAVDPKECYPKLIDVSPAARPILKDRISAREFEMMSMFTQFGKDNDDDPFDLW